LRGSMRRFGLLDMRLSIPAGVSKDRLAIRIADEILKKLQ